MKSNLFTLLVSALVAVAFVNCASEPTAKESVHVYLCFGQSNMYGSADIESIDSIIPSRYKMMAPTETETSEQRLGEIYDAVPPMFNFGAGLSPADYFGRTMAEAMGENVTVLLIPVAVPGCDIRLFDKDLYTDYLNDFDGAQWYQNILNAYGRNPYERLISLAKQAQEQGAVIEGVILHQGETNNNDTEWPNYVSKIYNYMLADLSLEAADCPLVAGEVVHEEFDGTCATMNTIIDKLPETIPTASVVTSEGCPAREDNVHFNSEGVREMGRRYAAKMLEAKGF